ncbi:hypothetical protein ACFV1L_10240 [Kitasatospora sp. NPDC059646]|uniref:hypothetical protein n=1 Tax=Kitasatospora sp. NPDC059646 TaxID=3346893 RepID=UPI0036859576
MPAALNTYVHVVGEDGRVVVFGPGDAVPSWAYPLITNPKAWAKEPELPAEPAPKPAAKKAAARARKAVADGDLQSG